MDRWTGWPAKGVIWSIPEICSLWSPFGFSFESEIILWAFLISWSRNMSGQAFRFHTTTVKCNWFCRSLDIWSLASQKPSEIQMKIVWRLKWNHLRKPKKIKGVKAQNITKLRELADVASQWRRVLSSYDSRPRCHAGDLRELAEAGSWGMDVGRGMSQSLQGSQRHVQLQSFFFKKERCFWFVLATVLLILVKHFCWHQRFAQNMQIAADWDLPRAILTVWKSRWNSLFKQSLRNLQSMDWYVIRPSDLRLSSRQWFKVWKMERDCAIVCSLVWRGVFAKSSVVSL